MQPNNVISPGIHEGQEESACVTGTLAGSIPIGDGAGTPITERRAACLLWPVPWKQNRCQFAVDGYLVWPDHLMLGQSQDDMYAVGEAILDDPVKWLREVRNGCFNIVVHDYRRRKTLFVSDRFGFLPLYLLRKEDGWWFASDLESLRNIAPYRLELDKTGLAELYWFGYQIGDRTAYQDVRMMPAGTIISLSWLDGAVTEESWSSATEPCQDADCVSLEEAPAQYVELVRAACDRLHNPDLRYGITLSGGMDSRMIAACWQARPLCTYTWGDEGSTELRIAAKVAKRLGFQHTEISVQGNFFKTVYPPMFKKYGLVEFVSGLGVPSMVNNGTQVVLDGIMNDRLFAIVRKCTETLSDKVRWALGLHYDYSPVSMSNDAVAERIYGSIRRSDECISFIPADVKREIDVQRDSILHDLALEVEKARGEDRSVDEVIERVKVNNRVRRYVSLICTLSRPQIQTCFPFLDTALLEYANRIRYTDKANKRFLIKVYSEQLRHICDIPPLMSLLPFYLPRAAHCYGRMYRYLREIAGEKALHLSHGHIRLKTVDAFRWAKWVASNAAFRDGIMEYLEDSSAVDCRALSKLMQSASEYRIWVNARLLYAVSFCAWYKPQYAESI